jgi:hypothetical protein
MFQGKDVEEASAVGDATVTIFRFKSSETPLNCRTISSTASSTLTASIKNIEHYDKN